MRTPRGRSTLGPRRHSWGSTHTPARLLVLGKNSVRSSEDERLGAGLRVRSPHSQRRWHGGHGEQSVSARQGGLAGARKGPEELRRPCVQADNISALTRAAGVEVEPYWPGLFAKLVEKKSIEAS